jgi:hypothetical protein
MADLPVGKRNNELGSKGCHSKGCQPSTLTTSWRWRWQQYHMRGGGGGGCGGGGGDGGGKKQWSSASGRDWMAKDVGQVSSKP